MDAAARQFSEAYDAGQHPMEFVNSMRKKGELIMGVGHRVKSINNPDMRVTIIKVLHFGGLRFFWNVTFGFSSLNFV